jgi:V-type H+-transporting ATPase subunit H
VFLNILRSISNEEIVEYVHGLIDDMLTGVHLFILYIRYLGYELFLANPKQVALFYDKSMSGEDIYMILFLR